MNSILKHPKGRVNYVWNPKKWSMKVDDAFDIVFSFLFCFDPVHHAHYSTSFPRDLPPTYYRN